MSRLICTFAVLGLLVGGVVRVEADDYSLGKADELPEGLSDSIAAAIDPNGVSLAGPKRGYASIWLVKELSIPADFKASAAVRYPFAPGELVGVLAVPKRADFLEFRGNELEQGTYTLRYGRQPMDGNHIGTSDLADFLVAIPAEKDEAAGVMEDQQEMVELSAAASGTTHPAILSLQPAEEAGDATLTHDEGREFWILQLPATVKRGDAAGKLPIRLVVVGVSEG